MKKKSDKPEKKKREEKPACEWTTNEAIEQLFPRPLVDSVKRDLEHMKKPDWQPMPGE
ncbi:MAG TPA: hypothetical protein VKD72_30395 [Gemmataceae bacterium]|nr:hypothetical protein [Gemmataceae bacterium]